MISALRLHLSMVTHETKWTSYLVQIDTQQLSFTGTCVAGGIAVTGEPLTHGFGDLVRAFAESVRDDAVTAVATRLRTGATVAVHGRAGVGRSTVARALTAMGVRVTDDRRADVDVFVVAEVVKPEDRAAIERSSRPALLVLNKADLSGVAAGGPMAAAHDRCLTLRDLTGLETVPTAAHLATVDLDDELLAALRALVTAPADLTSIRHFRAQPHPLPAAIRARLVDTLDLFGIAHAVLALRDRPGADAAAVHAALRRRSGVAAVVERLAPLLVRAEHTRITDAVAELERYAIVADAATADAVTAFLGSDEVVLARMAAAADAVGLRVEQTDDRAAHLRRALHWQQRTRGPLSAAHLRCAHDITRGSLRLYQRHAAT